jgi:hypothetical protein
VTLVQYFSHPPQATHFFYLLVVESYFFAYFDPNKLPLPPANGLSRPSYKSDRQYFEAKSNLMHNDYGTALDIVASHIVGPISQFPSEKNGR